MIFFRMLCRALRRLRWRVLPSPVDSIERLAIRIELHGVDLSYAVSRCAKEKALRGGNIPDVRLTGARGSLTWGLACRDFLSGEGSLAVAARQSSFLLLLDHGSLAAFALPWRLRDRAAQPRQPSPLMPGRPSTAPALTASGASGLADRARGRRLTIDDPVRIASISKLVVALGVMRLVEQGRLDLDRDVSDYLGWRLRNPAFPDRPITLAAAALAPLVAAGRCRLCVRSGRRCTARSPIRPRSTPRIAPGTFFRYSNLNFPVIASVMERASGERFDRLMARLVLGRCARRLLQLDDLRRRGDRARGRALRAGRERVRDDLGGRRPDCPVLAPNGCDLSAYVPGSNGALFSPQGGLRISVRDLAVIGRMLLAAAGTAAPLPERSEHRHVDHARLALRREQWRHRQRLLLRLRACRAEPAGRAGGLQRRSVRPWPGDVRPCRRRLWRCAPASGSIPRAASASPFSPPAMATIRRAAAPPFARSRSNWPATSPVQALDRQSC